jgi:Mg2+-importing ATPase
LSTSRICGIGAFLPYSHFTHALGLVPLPLEYWIALAGILVLYLGLTQLVKG